MVLDHFLLETVVDVFKLLILVLEDFILFGYFDEVLLEQFDLVLLIENLLF